LFWTVFVLSAVAGMAVIPVMIYPIAVAIVWYVVATRSEKGDFRYQALRPLIYGIAAWIVLTVLWYLPAIAVSGISIFTTSGFNDYSLGEWFGQISNRLMNVVAAAHHQQYMLISVIMVFGLAAGASFRPGLATALLIVPLLFGLQRTVPFVRVFLPLILLYYTIAAGGLGRIIDRIGYVLPRLTPARIAGLLLGLCLSPILSMASSSMPPVFAGEHQLPEGPQVAEFLDGKVNEQVPVLTDVASDSPLIYYFRSRGLPEKWVLSQGMIERDYSKIWIVANDRFYKTQLGNIREANKLAALGFTDFELRKDYGKVKIYIARKE
jgi:hypothetical protein